MEHLKHFGLEREPFRNEPQVEFWFGAAGHVAAGKRLRRCAEQGKELCVLVGEVGSGTTTLTRALFEQLDPDRFEMALLVPMRGVAADALRGMVARQLGVESPPRESAECMRQLFAHLVALRSQGRHAIVAIDEAHGLDAAAFAELRTLLNLEFEDRRLVTLLLVGTPALADSIEADAGFAGRVELQVALPPLAAAEAHAYLAHRIELAGGEPGLFEEAVAEAIAARAAGLPRRLNALADATLFEAHLAQHARPTLYDVERAARDLPWAHAALVTSPLAESIELESSAPEPPPAVSDDDGLDASFGVAEPALESLRDADAASFADLDLPEAEPDLGDDVGRDVEHALAADADETGDAAGRFALDRTTPGDEIEADLLSEQTAPGAWQSPSPVATADADTTASRGKPAAAAPVSPATPVPDDDELDNLFVDLVEEA